MKHLPVFLALVCAVLVVALFAMKRSDDAQHGADAGVIADLSNQLDSAETQIAISHGTIAVFSNRLDQSLSAALRSPINWRKPGPPSFSARKKSPT